MKILMENKKNKLPRLNFFYKRNIQQLIIPILIILIATAMAGRKQFVLNPYESFDPMPQVATITLFDSISDIYTGQGPAQAQTAA